MSTKPSSKAKEPADGPPPPRAKPVADTELEERLQIVFVSAEVAPYSKTGGLGDVAGSLPFALAEKGHRVMIITPRCISLISHKRCPPDVQKCRYLNGTTDVLYAEARDSGCDVTLDMGHGGLQRVKYYAVRTKDVDVVFVDHPCFHRSGNPYGDALGTFKDNTYRHVHRETSRRSMESMACIADLPF